MNRRTFQAQFTNEVAVQIIPAEVKTGEFFEMAGRSHRGGEVVQLPLQPDSFDQPLAEHLPRPVREVPGYKSRHFHRDVYKAALESPGQAEFPQWPDPLFAVPGKQLL